MTLLCCHGDDSDVRSACVPMTSDPCLLSKPLPVFNRCTPLDVSCYSKFADAMVTFVSDDNSLQRLVSSLAASKEVIAGLCVLALGELRVDLGGAGPCEPRSPVLCPVSSPVLSMLLMLIIRYISAVLVWILTSLVVLGSLGELISCLLLTEAASGLRSPPVSVSVSAGTSVLWWLYIDHRLSGNDTSTKTKDSKEEAEFRRDGGQTLLVYAVAATVFTVGGASEPGEGPEPGWLPAADPS